MKVLILLTLGLTLSFYAHASNTVVVGDVNFGIERPNALNALNSSMDDIGGILKRFKPIGAQIKNLKVTGNVLQFRVVKNILMSANIKAIVEVEKQNASCPINSAASYKVLMDLRESDNIVSSNIETLTIDVCARETEVDQLVINGKGVIFKASTYSNNIGGQMVSGMADQVPAIAEAIRAQIMSLP